MSINDGNFTTSTVPGCWYRGYFGATGTGSSGSQSHIEVNIFRAVERYPGLGWRRSTGADLVDFHIYLKSLSTGESPF